MGRSCKVRIILVSDLELERDFNKESPGTTNTWFVFTLVIFYPSKHLGSIISIFKVVLWEIVGKMEKRMRIVLLEEKMVLHNDIF